MNLRPTITTPARLRLLATHVLAAVLAMCGTVALAATDLIISEVVEGNRLALEVTVR